MRSRLYGGRCVDDEEDFRQLVQHHDDTIRAAISTGEATRLGDYSDSPVTYQGAYWTPDENGWNQFGYIAVTSSWISATEIAFTKQRRPARPRRSQGHLSSLHNLLLDELVDLDDLLLDVDRCEAGSSGPALLPRPLPTGLEHHLGRVRD